MKEAARGLASLTTTAVTTFTGGAATPGKNQTCVASLGSQRNGRPSNAAAAAAFEGRPFRWDPSEATHVWFFPGVVAPPVKVVTAVVVRDARPRAASFIRDDDDTRRPRASSTCGVRGFEAEGG